MPRNSDIPMIVIVASFVAACAVFMVALFMEPTPLLAATVGDWITVHLPPFVPLGLAGGFGCIFLALFMQSRRTR